MTAESLFEFVDLTYLGEDEDKAKAFLKRAKTLPLAAVCITPKFVPLARKKGQLNIASVLNFPGGDHPKDTVLKEIQSLIMMEVDEIDIVFPYHDFLKGIKEEALQRFKSYIDTIPTHIIKKVIIETGELKKEQIITTLCQRLIDLPIDFIKTSTGKTPMGATLKSAETILKVIKGTDKGLKVSGGIRTITDAKAYLHLAKRYFEDRPLTAKCFRIGASQLTDAVA